jgi:hypothetical protein
LPAKFGQPWCNDHRQIVYVVGRPLSHRIKVPPQPVPQES